MELLVLSPHRDDAVFSLFFALSSWSSQGIVLRVRNFFTVSDYGPHGGSSGRQEVTLARRREDRRALRALPVHCEDAGLLDAPLRLPIPFSQICAPDSRRFLDQQEMDALSRGIRAQALTLVPLALGDHVDHWAVHLAALQALPAPMLGFYEDLPYASWTPEDVIRERVGQVEVGTRTRFRPLLFRAGKGLGPKRRAAGLYRSQITRAEADSIARFSVEHGGERIWVPAHSRRWSSLGRNTC